MSVKSDRTKSLEGRVEVTPSRTIPGSEIRKSESWFGRGGVGVVCRRRGPDGFLHNPTPTPGLFGANCLVSRRRSGPSVGESPCS